MSANRAPLLRAAALCGLILLVLGRVVMHDFVELDDPYLITANPLLNPPTGRSLAEFWSHAQTNLYMPLTYSWWAMLAKFARVGQPDASGAMLNPWLFHAGNLALHVATTLLVLSIFDRLMADPNAAWLGAALFAIHPLQVESVAWASDAKDLLCTLFLAAALRSAIAFRDHRRRKFYALALVCVLAGCLSKPTAVVAPILLIATDIIAMQVSPRRSLLTWWPTLLIGGIFSIVNMRVQPLVFRSLIAPWQRPLVAADAIGFYLAKFLWPVKLAVDYGRTPSRVMADPLLLLWCALPIAAAIALAMLARRRALVALGAVLALAGLLPVLGFVPFLFQTISTVADHYCYLPMIGVSLIFAVLLARRQIAIQVTAAVLIVALAARSTFAAASWRDGETLFTQALRVNPDGALAHTNLGNALLQRGDIPAAESQFQQAIQSGPNNAFAHLALARLLSARGDMHAAVAEYQSALRIYQTQLNYDPTLGGDVLVAIAQAMLNAGQPAEAKEALLSGRELGIHDERIDAMLVRLDQLGRALTPATSQAAEPLP